MKRYIPFLLTLMVVLGCPQGYSAQLAALDWEVDSVTTYSRIKDGMGVSLQDPSSFEGDVEPYVYRNPELSTLFQEAQHVDGRVLWKGSKYADVKLTDGTPFVIHISNYGSFFTVEGMNGYFDFKGEAADTWERIIFGRE